ncbi:class II aldolase/adducin family protein [Actinocatenispora rupis]|uniref:Fuculose phosphate aldolase n=1 Tax=Actinocatenispora rupis TaxID=519421 RepID=A0A8J3NEG2_9ACTN|nr:class II aldolase/adducin family protein [Actinocatenispora rupis]GID13925.1 fuculose phosphate aldolase [Actinocatenispora rupis]
MLLAAERAEIVDVCRRLVADKLVVGTAGNVSVRVDDLVAVTPTGVDYHTLTPEQVGVHRLDGTPVDAPLKPTSEAPMHLACYAARQPGAVVHTHSTAATALSCLVDEVPPVHYYLAMFGGRVRVAQYATYGTPELAEHMLAALGGGTGCLLGNHGAVTTGDTLTAAYDRAVYLEYVCDVALRVLGSGCPPRLLDDAELTRVTQRIAGYGQR